MKTTEILQSARERFEKETEKLVFGILSGDENSPVFINQTMERPRLMNIFESELRIALKSFADGVKKEVQHESYRNERLGRIISQDDVLSIIDKELEG